MSSVTTVCGLISKCRLRATYRARSQVCSRQIRKHGKSARRPGIRSCGGAVSLAGGPEAGVGLMVPRCAWMVPDAGRQWPDGLLRLALHRLPGREYAGLGVTRVLQ